TPVDPMHPVQSLRGSRDGARTRPRMTVGCPDELDTLPLPCGFPGSLYPESLPLLNRTDASAKTEEQSFKESLLTPHTILFMPISEQLASRIERARSEADDFRKTADNLLVDIAGLCIAARKTDYVLAALKSWESSGACAAIGHTRALD